MKAECEYNFVYMSGCTIWGMLTYYCLKTYLWIDFGKETFFIVQNYRKILCYGIVLAFGSCLKILFHFSYEFGFIFQYIPFIMTWWAYILCVCPKYWVDDNLIKRFSLKVIYHTLIEIDELKPNRTRNIGWLRMLKKK